MAELKTKDGLYFHIINHAIQVFFKISFLGFVNAPVMCIYVSSILTFDFDFFGLSLTLLGPNGIFLGLE